MVSYISYEQKMQQVTVCKEKYFLDQSDLPNFDVIKLGLNTIEMPVFSKNTRIGEYVSMTYIFSSEDEYVQIIPATDPNNICNKILQEFDEKLFYGLKRIYQATGNPYMIGTYRFFMEWAGIPYNGFNLLRTKDGFQRMDGCSIVFNKSYYDVGEKVKGNLYIKRNKRFSLTQGLETLSIVELKDMEKNASNIDAFEFFENNKKAKEIIKFRLSDEVIEELSHKSFRYFNHKELLKINNAVARKIAMMLVKWQHWLKTNVFKRKCSFIASRVPLSWKHPGSTIRNIANACNELTDEKNKLEQEFRVLEGYELIGKGKNSEIEFYMKKNKLYMVNEQLDTSGTGQEMLQIEEVKEDNIKNTPNIINADYHEIKDKHKTAPINNDIDRKNDFMAILDLVPLKHQNTKKVHKLINKYLKSKGFDYVARLVKFSAANSTGGFSGFLEGALENDWDTERKQSSQNNKINKTQNNKIKEAKMGAVRCYNNCKGGCAATWDKHQSETDMCYWCKKFARQKAFVGSQPQPQPVVAPTSKPIPVAEPEPEPLPPKKHPVWEEVKKILSQNLPTHSMTMWIDPLVPDFDKTTENQLVLICPSSFSKKRVSDNFLKYMNDVCQTCQDGIQITLSSLQRTAR